MAGDREGRVRGRAHEIWEQEGRPTGQEKRHWDQASSEIDIEEVASAGKAAGAKKRPGKKNVAAGSKPASKATIAADVAKPGRGKKA